MQRVFVCFLCFALFFGVLAGDAFALQPVTPVTLKPAPLVKVLAKLGTGTDAFVAVRLRDNSVLSGWVESCGPLGFTLVDSQTGRRTLVRFAEVNRLAGYNLASGVQVRHGGGVRAKLVSAVTYLIPGGRVPTNSLTGGEKKILIGIVIGILIAIILAKVL